MWRPGDTTPGSIATVARRPQAAARCVARQRRVARPSDAPAPGHARRAARGRWSNLRDGTQFGPSRANTPAQIMGGAFSPDGSLVATERRRRGDAPVGRRDRRPGGDCSRAMTARSGPRRSRTSAGTSPCTPTSLDGTMMTWDLSGSRRLGEPFRAGAGTDGPPRTCRRRAARRGQPGRAPAGHERRRRHLDPRRRDACRGPHDQGRRGPTARSTRHGHRMARGWRSRAPGRTIVELYDTATWQLVAPGRRVARAGPAPIVQRARRDRPQQSHRHRAAAQHRPRGRVLAGLGGARRRRRRRRGLDVGCQDRSTRRTPAAGRRARCSTSRSTRYRTHSRSAHWADPQAGVATVFAPGAREAAVHGQRRRRLRPPGRRRLQPGRHRPRDGRRDGRRPVLERGDRDGDQSTRRHVGRLGPRPRVDPVGQDVGQLRDGRDGAADRRGHEDRRRRPARDSRTTGSMRRRPRTAPAFTSRTGTARASTGRSILPSGPRTPARSPVAP